MRKSKALYGSMAGLVILTSFDCSIRAGGTALLDAIMHHRRVNMTNAIAINLPASTFIRTVKDKDGKGVAFNVDWADLPVEVVARICEAGAKVILTNAYNGGGKDVSEAEKTAAMAKKLDSWKRGEFNVIERGESFYTAWKQVFLADCVAAGMTVSAAEGLIKAKVEERLGKETKATFANYLEATALEYVDAGEFDDKAEALAALEAHYGAEAQKRAEEAAKVAAKLAAPKLDLSAFKKAK